jgi:hypothetical protein
VSYFMKSRTALIHREDCWHYQQCLESCHHQTRPNHHAEDWVEVDVAVVKAVAVLLAPDCSRAVYRQNLEGVHQPALGFCGHCQAWRDFNLRLADVSGRPISAA